MLKREITYEDFDGNQRTDVFYFNMSKAELVEMEITSPDGGYGARLQKIVNSKDNAALFKEFKALILGAYGVKSEDGREFMKSEEISARFERTSAYSALMMEFMTNDEAASKFITDILPKDLSKELETVLQAPSPANTVPMQLPPLPPSPAT